MCWLRKRLLRNSGGSKTIVAKLTLLDFSFKQQLVFEQFSMKWVQLIGNLIRAKASLTMFLVYFETGIIIALFYYPQLRQVLSSLNSIIDK